MYETTVDDQTVVAILDIHGPDIAETDLILDEIEMVLAGLGTV